MLSVIVPVRDEADNVERLFDALARSVRSNTEVLIVYDSDNDSTLPKARAERERLPFELRFVKNTLGPGPGSALRSGFASARGEAVAVVMADLSDDLSLVDRMYERVKAGDDVVCASRYMRGGRQIGGPLLKRTLSRLAGISLHAIGVPTHDPTNAFKAYRAESIGKLDLAADRGFEISMQIVVKAWLADMKISELPATWTDRTAGISKFKLWTWLPRYLHWYSFALRGRLARLTGLS